MPHQDWLHRTFHAYESKLVHYAWSIVGDMETARDIAQDTFLKLCHESPDTVGDPPNAWLYKICRNRAIDHYRKNKRHRHESAEQLDDHAANDETPHEQLSRREQVSGILSALASLPEREQEIVRLKFLHDFSYKQIADTVGLSPGNVGYILHGALVKLREQVANDENSTQRRGEFSLKKDSAKPQPPSSKKLRVPCVSALKNFLFPTLTGTTV